MSMLRKIAVTGLVSLTLAVGSIATVTPALAHGGGGHGGESHGGGGEHMGGEHFGGMGMGHFAENRGGGFFGHDHFGRDHFDGRFRDREALLFGSNDDYDRCQWQWMAAPDGRTIRGEVCY
ncbi:hypothetical protein FHT82_004377 [Rhizobium sp. BK275]|uniref:hypothetical protein n=1 Tax=Rhizobium sp. BK275 TaxID=2587077 RepID=UPI00161DBE05|nr:hypothetical protein [Rhizobium sp. BK275]MBB3391599.1 hypothetical protein [Rhizobium sp. BK275]